MELSPRKRAILAAIVSNYITGGEPIGSKALCDMLDLHLSSATLRNEMNDLCTMGLLEQPHTSAGRVPTLRGYRVYVNDLMHPAKLSSEVRLAIDSTLQTIARTPEQMPEMACQILADLTGLPSFTATVTNESAKVKRVRLIPMGKRTVLMVVVSTDGAAKSRIVLSDCTVNEDLLSLFSNICKVCIVGHRLYELNTAYLQSIVARVGDFSLSVMPLLSNLFQLIGEMFEPQLTFRGESKLLSGYRQMPDSVRLSELISQKEAILSIVSRMEAPVGVIFGDDFGHRIDTTPSCMVVAKYKIGEKELGRIGVIGSVRLSYEQLIPSVEYFAQRLGTLMTKAFKDMED